MAGAVLRHGRCVEVAVLGYGCRLASPALGNERVIVVTILEDVSRLRTAGLSRAGKVARTFLQDRGVVVRSTAATLIDARSVAVTCAAKCYPLSDRSGLVVAKLIDRCRVGVTVLGDRGIVRAASVATLIDDCTVTGSTAVVRANLFNEGRLVLAELSGACAIIIARLDNGRRLPLTKTAVENAGKATGSVAALIDDSIIAIAALGYSSILIDTALIDVCFIQIAVL